MPLVQKNYHERLDYLRLRLEVRNRKSEVFNFFINSKLFKSRINFVIVISDF